MRTFVALEIPESTRAGVAAVQSRLKHAGVDARWPRPGNLHLTLKFLGETDEDRAGGIVTALALELAGSDRFRLGIRGIGVFPGSGVPRVVWLGIGGEVEKLLALQAAVERAMAGLGFAPEGRPYAPHLTLGRIRRIRNRDAWRQGLAEVREVTLPGFEVAAVSLFRSEIGPGGAVHHTLGAVALGQEPEPAQPSARRDAAASGSSPPSSARNGAP